MLNFATYSSENELFDCLYCYTITIIRDCYLDFFPDKTAEDLQKEIDAYFNSGEVINSEKIIADLYKLEANAVMDLSKAFLAPIALCEEARQKFEARHSGDAWQCIHAAIHWNGVLYGASRFGKEAVSSSIRTLSVNAKKGGQKSAENKYKDTKEHAFKLAREQQWNSRAEAVRKIEKRVVAFSKTKPTYAALEEISASETIDGWLKTMHDAEYLFAALKKQNKNTKSSNLVK
ncbi:hypothetical protein [uncultured Deefgea sp.]|uniref:hypothetical protein n=1 Tax=uncultured Deefgea sp. TaxID=1304914 RepID=UPI0025987E10|nr:hypothetical protein [uncultured Deefgea sp.]